MSDGDYQDFTLLVAAATALGVTADVVKVPHHGSKTSSSLEWIRAAHPTAAAARTALYPAELPVGVITAFLGAPFFLWLLVRQVRTGRIA